MKNHGSSCDSIFAERDWCFRAIRTASDDCRPASRSIGGSKSAAGAPRADSDEHHSCAARNRRTTISIDQLPANSSPASSSTGGIAAVPTASPPAGLPEEVRRAWIVLTLRGEQPTAESLTNYLGPETMTRLFGQPSLPPSLLSLLNTEPNR